MNRIRLIAYSLAGGALITLITGVIPHRTVLGGTHFGFPMAWLIRRALAPEHFPWRIHWLGFVDDILVWTVIVMAILVLYDRFDSGSMDGQSM